MKNYHLTLIVWFFITISTIILVKQFLPAADPALSAKQLVVAQAKLDLQLQHLARNDAAVFYGGLSLTGVIGLSVLIVAAGVHRARVKKASVHTYKFSNGVEVVIHERDLSVAWQIITGLTNAEELKAMNGGMEKAFQLYATMADVQSRQIQALLGKRGLQPAFPETITPPPVTPPHTIVEPVPTFQELLQRGEIAPGKPMILGFEQGVPRRGSFLDIYSAAVAGESGSGKTITLLYLIGSGIVAFQVRFIVIDPHDPHPKALGPKIKPLVAQGLVTLATKKADIFHALQTVEGILDDRLNQKDDDTTPVVLVLDELTLLSKMSVGATVFRVMERISTEGRKCAVYMLASSQTWLAARTGDTSIVRDTLTSAYVHRIKPKQAQLLLQDKHEVEKVKQLKDAGEVLLCPVNDDSVVCKIPYTTERDMQMIAEMTGDAKPHVNQMNHAEQQPDSAELPKIRQIEKATGIPYSPLQRYFAKGTPLKEEYKVKLEAYLFQQKQVESVLKSVESGDESSLNQTKVIQ